MLLHIVHSDSTNQQQYKHKMYQYVFIFILGASERISSKTYVIVSGNVACIRRLNGTHQVGCSCKSLNLRHCCIYTWMFELLTVIYCNLLLSTGKKNLTIDGCIYTQF